MESIRVRGKKKKGRPRRRPRVLYGDTKYNTPLNRIYLEKKRIRRRMPGKGVPGNQLYSKVRYTIERFFAWLKSFRRIVIRWDRLPLIYLGFVQLGCILILLRWVSR
jgi:transposase